jgi:hypothetical protein
LQERFCDLRATLTGSGDEDGAGEEEPSARFRFTIANQWLSVVDVLVEILD